jgi:hypothetical protein
MDKTIIWSFLVSSALLVSACAGQQLTPTSSDLMPTSSAQPTSEASLPTTPSAPTNTPTSIPPTLPPTATFTMLPPTPSFTPTPTETPDPLARLGGCPNGETKQGQVRLVINNNSGSAVYMRLIGRYTGACYLISVPGGSNGGVETMTFNVLTDLYDRKTLQCDEQMSAGTISIDGNIRLNFTPCKN